MSGKEKMESECTQDQITTEKKGLHITFLVEAGHQQQMRMKAFDCSENLD